MKRISLFLIAFIFFILPLYSQTDLIPRFKDQSRLFVYPVFFVPNDADLTQEELNRANELLQTHLKIAQSHYQDLLTTDTFFISDREDNKFSASKGNSYYAEIDAGENSDSAHRILKELFEWNRDDRVNSNLIYLVIYVRPSNKGYKGGTQWFGGARTFNGVPGSGGGYVEMEYSSLLSDYPYPFQSTLVHELGHAFGLTHVDCFGYDMNSNDSIMSYNLVHNSKGTTQSTTPGTFTAEDYFILALNKRAFPNFEYKSEIHNQKGKPLDDVQGCFLGPMNPSIGEFIRSPEIGYELFFNEQLVSGPAASYYSFSQSQNNCEWNAENHKGIKVECRYNGVVFYPKSDDTSR